jgi:RNA polymerase sigma factor (TIGR02999 family)
VKRKRSVIGGISDAENTRLLSLQFNAISRPTHLSVGFDILTAPEFPSVGNRFISRPVDVLPMSDVIRIMSAIDAGEPRAAEQLLPLVYDELRTLAAQKMAREKPGQTLDATALVHEAWLRLVGSQDNRQWDSRGHFFAAAAEAMRRILVDSARRRQSVKRGGKRLRESLDEAVLAAPETPADLIALDEALSRLEAIDPRAAELVKLRFFAGLTIPQVADALGVSPRTADDVWAYARAWLFRELRETSA